MRIYYYYVECLHGFEVKFYNSFCICRFSQTGQRIQTIRPVNSVLPKDSSGALDFTSESDPVTRRAANQGNFFFIRIPSKLNISAM